MAIAAKKPAAAKPAATPAKTAPAASSEAHEVKVTTSITVLENGTIKGVPVEAAETEVKVFATKPATTGVNIGVTKALGNFESVKFGVHITMPCYVEEFDSATAQIIDKAKSVLDELVASFDPTAYVSGGAIDGNAELAEPGAEDTSGEGEPDGGIDEAWVDAASREELIEVITANSIDIDPNDYPEDDDLKEMFKATVLSEEGTEGEPAAEGEEAADEPLTQEALEAATTDELKEVYEAWEMGAFPKFSNAASEKVARKTAIKKILEKQEENAAA